jgi:hypothetical protein
MRFVCDLLEEAPPRPGLPWSSTLLSARRKRLGATTDPDDIHVRGGRVTRCDRSWTVEVLEVRPDGVYSRETRLPREAEFVPPTLDAFLAERYSRFPEQLIAVDRAELGRECKRAQLAGRWIEVAGVPVDPELLAPLARGLRGRLVVAYGWHAPDEKGLLLLEDPDGSRAALAPVDVAMWEKDRNNQRTTR